MSPLPEGEAEPGRIGGTLLTVEPRLRRAVPYALFLLLVCVFLWRPIFTGAALLPGEYLARMRPWNSVLQASDPPPQWNPLVWDAIAQFYPWRVFYARSMSSGCIPLWNPHQFCGTPFLANGQSAVLYPLNLIFLIVDPITAFTILAALHLFLASSFTYALLRELGARELGGIVGGIVYAFSAFMVLWLELPTFAAAAAWLPLALLLIHRAVERRSLLCGMLSGLALAMPVLAGHFQIAFYVILAAALWWLWKLVETLRAERAAHALPRVCIPCIGCIVVLALIAAPQVLSTLELAQLSHRVRDVTAEGYSRFVDHAVKPYRMITAFQPDFYGSPAANDYFLGSAADYMEFGLYAGVLPLMLAVIGACRLRGARSSGFFALLTVFALLIALGTRLNALFYFLVPGFSGLGGPNRILVLYFLGVAGLAGFGAEWLAGQKPATTPDRRARVIGIGAFVVVVVAGGLARIPAQAFLGAVSVGDPIRGYESPVYPVFVVMSGALVTAAVTRGVRSQVLAALAVAFVVADLFIFGIAFNPTCDRSRVYPRTPLTSRLCEIAGDRRIAPINPRWSLYQTPDAVLPPNAATVYGLYDVQGYDSLFTRAYKDLSSEVQGMDSSPPENGNMVLVRRLIGDRLGRDLQVRWVLAAGPLGPFGDLPVLHEVDTVGGVWIYEFAESDLSDYRGAEATPAVNGHVPVYESPNAAIAARGAGPVYPGWTERDVTECGRRARGDQAEEYRLFVFEPFTFRLGLFFMLVGVGSLTCAAACKHLLAREAA